jgi:hypothetical protein
VAIVASKSCSEFFLTQLLWLVQADDKLLGAQKNAVHTVHRSGSLIRCLVGYKAKAAALTGFVAHDTSTNDLTKLAKM